jgi:hypothetical protein
MKTIKTALLTGAILLGIGAGAIHTGTASAQAVSDGSASIACVAAAGNWTDCTLTLNRGIAAGGSVSASLAHDQGTVVFCADGVSEEPACGLNGNAAVFLCPSGCVAGTQFLLSALGAQGASAAHEFSIAGGSASAQSTNSIGARPVPLEDEGNRF